jgi:uncharacterized protein YecE (DUF72 family)
MPEARVGISGWRYAPWRGDFYPRGLQQRRELEFASSRLRTIEINGTFYGLQKESSWRVWRDTVPDDFVFCVKGGRYITHLLRLRNPEDALEEFFAQGLFQLGPKLGPILWQLPAAVDFEPKTLEHFLSLLPRRAPDGSPLRHAMEVRSHTFINETYFSMLERHGVASVIADTAGTFPVLDRVLGDLVYVRLHGDVELYASGYSDSALDHWAERARGWLDEGRDVFVFFDNDIKVRAPYDAMGLASRLGWTGVTDTLF